MRSVDLSEDSAASAVDSEWVLPKLMLVADIYSGEQFD